GTKGVALDTIECERTPISNGEKLSYRHVDLTIDRTQRTAELTITAPDKAPKTDAEAFAEGNRWWLFRAFRELDQALLELRLNESDIGLVLLRAKGSLSTVLATDELLAKEGHWFVREVKHFVKRTLKRLDVTSKSFYAIADEGTAFGGTFLELAL